MWGANVEEKSEVIAFSNQTTYCTSMLQICKVSGDYVIMRKIADTQDENYVVNKKVCWPLDTGSWRLEITPIFWIQKDEIDHFRAMYKSEITFSLGAIIFIQDKSSSWCCDFEALG